MTFLRLIFTGKKTHLFLVSQRTMDDGVAAQSTNTQQQVRSSTASPFTQKHLYTYTIYSYA